MPRQAFAVVRYWKGQRYGGPEEGGWWYTTYDRTDDWADTIEWYLNEDVAYEAARLYNGWAGNREEAYVIEVPRLELKPEYAEQACHMYGEEFKSEDYEWRTDIPEYLPEARPHYC